MTPFELIQYVALEQLDTLAVQGVARAMAGFANISEEAEGYANQMLESYGGIGPDDDPGDFFGEAHDQGVQYYQLLSALRQAMLNLLTAGMYHLFEQHREMLKASLKAHGRIVAELDDLPRWPRVEELRLVANTVKHGDGSSATALRAKRPDLFVPPALRSSPIAKHITRPVSNPLGGTDLFVSEKDIEVYRDALRELWEDVRRVV